MSLRDDGGTPIVNFGGNVAFTPRHRYAPRTEEEVLEVLDRHAGGAIRVIASLHSWSDDTVSDDVVLDLRYFDAVSIETRDGQSFATVGAGCVLSDAIDRIRAASDATLPTIGAVKVQRMAGAVSTATHGSGRGSLSHYMAELRIAAYDPETGKAKIFDFKEGDERLAARCAIGAMGVVLAVKFPCVPKYYVSEALVPRATLDDVLASEGAFPLQQFILIPYLWSYVVFQRAEAGTEKAGKPSWWRGIYRFYKLVVIDVFLHLFVKALVWIGNRGFIRFFYRRLFLLFVWKNSTVVDRSEETLTTHHEFFKHLEMEVFVPAARLRDAAAMIRYIVSVADGSDVQKDEAAEAALAGAGLLDELRALAGFYTHHYPIFFRRVLPDEALIAMTAGAAEPYYTISFFSYHEPRTDFYAFARFLARALNRIHGAVLHWGKYFPLEYADVQSHYPRLPEFRAACRRYDARGTFRKGYAGRVLGFDRDG
jgi:FAD/FMN-containing dehydrogenase